MGPDLVDQRPLGAQALPDDGVAPLHVPGDRRQERLEVEFRGVFHGGAGMLGGGRGGVNEGGFDACFRGALPVECAPLRGWPKPPKSWSYRCTPSSRPVASSTKSPRA